MEDDTLGLYNQLSFPLYTCAREMMKLYRPYLDALGITYTQYLALIVVWKKERISVKEIGEALHLDSGTLTPLLKKLEKKGLLNRRRSREDERVVVIVLTDKGRELRERAKDMPRRVAEQLGEFSGVSAEKLQALLRELMDALDKGMEG